MASGGDDRRVLLWPLDKTISGAGEPVAMVAEHRSNIFCLGFDTGATRLYSGGNDEQVRTSAFQVEKLCFLMFVKTSFLMFVKTNEIKLCQG